MGGPSTIKYLFWVFELEVPVRCASDRFPFKGKDSQNTPYIPQGDNKLKPSI